MTSALENLMLEMIRCSNIVMPLTEYHFCAEARWRFDLAWLEEKLAVELDGAIWQGGRHNRGAGYSNDCEKFNYAVMLDWRVLRFTRAMVESGEALAMIRAAMGHISTYSLLAERAEKIAVRRSEGSKA